MYLKSFTAKNFKCFTGKLTVTMPSDGGYAGWHVILGEGSPGKTSLLQGIALARLGDAGESELRRLTQYSCLSSKYRSHRFRSAGATTWGQMNIERG